MTTTATIKSYLKDIIGLGDNATGTARANAVIDQGMDDLAEISTFDEDDIQRLCAAVRKPGGTIADPNNAGQTMPDPGQSIPAISESRLKLATYGAKLYGQVGRDVEPTALARSRLNAFKLHKETVDNHTDPPKFPPVSKTFGIMKMIDALPTHLQELNGVSGIALAYVIRKDVDPPNPLPPLINDMPWSEPNTSMMEELVLYAAHAGASYKADNATVFRLIQNAVADTSHISSIKPYQRTRDGRKAYEALVLHNMGNSKWEKVVEEAESMVTTRIFNGKNARYPLKSHIVKHQEAHNDFVRAAQFTQFAPPSEHTRVRRLLSSIQSNDSALVAAKTTILADMAKRDDFEMASDFLLLAAPTKLVNNSRNHRIAALKRGRGGGGKYSGTGDKGKTGVEDRYYKRDEFHRLNDAQKAELQEMRQKNGRGGGKRARQTAKIAALEARLESQAQQISALSAKPSAKAEPEKSKNPLQPPVGFTQRE